jgi:hypothetical protein
MPAQRAMTGRDVDDDEQIDVADPAQVQAWAERLRVTPEEVLEAVRTAGERWSEVKAFVEGGGIRVP